MPEKIKGAPPSKWKGANDGLKTYPRRGVGVSAALKSLVYSVPATARDLYREPERVTPERLLLRPHGPFYGSGV